MGLRCWYFSFFCFFLMEWNGAVPRLVLGGIVWYRYGTAAFIPPTTACIGRRATCTRELPGASGWLVADVKIGTW